MPTRRQVNKSTLVSVIIIFTFSLFLGAFYVSAATSTTNNTVIINLSEADDVAVTEEAQFFLNPVPAVVDNPIIVLNGTKAANTSVFLNSQEIVSQSPDTQWESSFFLSPGKNNLKLVAKMQGEEVGEIETEITYNPPSAASIPIINIIKENLPSEVRSELEKAFENASQISREVTISDTAQKDIREALEKEVFHYLNKANSSSLSRFLSYEDQKETFTQTFGGPRITSSSHPNQNTWSSQNEVNLSWEKIGTATGYMVAVSDNPVDPISEVSADTNSQSVPKLPDGIWYFSVKALLPGGESLPNYYRLLIDTTPPQLISLEVADAYPVYKNGALVTLKLKFSDNLINAEEVNDLPSGLPVGFIDEDDLKNIQSRKNMIPDYSRLIDTDFSSMDTNFSKDRVMVESIKSSSDGSIEAIVSYRITTNNKKGDSKDLSVLVSVQDFVGNKSYANTQVSLENKSSPIQVVNSDDFSNLVSLPTLSTQGITFRGKSAPNSTVILQIFSENPMTVTVVSDNEGSWTYTLKETLPSGNHTVYAYVKKEGLEKEDIAQVASFSLVTEAQAKEIDELTKPVFSFTPIKASLPENLRSLPPLPAPIKLALALYTLSFISLITALIVWYRENPPHSI